MRYIPFAEPDTQQWKEWRALCASEQENRNEAIEAGHRPKVKREVYKGQKDVYMSLDGPFHGKCAYCEKRIFSDQYGDVEHFRPEARVDDHETGKPITIQQHGHTENHPGYYWLAYDYKNLLPSCILCNRDAKRNFFPVEDFRAVRPGEEEQERPLLVHPCFDDPATELEIDRTGVLIPKTERGKACRDILKLNERGLPDERKSVYNDVRTKMGVCLLEAARGMSGEAKKMLNDIENHENGMEAFTMVARTAIRDSKQACKAILSI